MKEKEEKQKKQQQKHLERLEKDLRENKGKKVVLGASHEVSDGM